MTRRRVHVTVVGWCGAVGAFLLGCGPSATVPATSEFAVTGRAAVRGMVVDQRGMPLDSVSVGVAIADGSALYQVLPMQTSGDGAFELVVERRGATPPSDSIDGAVIAQSLRRRDLQSDGAALTVRVPLRLLFVRPPARPLARELSLTVPTLD